MNHLTDEQLAARLDASGAHADVAADAHLAGCAECRARLADLAALDADLGRALAHDPGEAYFDTFADRVRARIAASGAVPVPAPAPRRGPFAWWNSPRSLALAGGAAALVAVVALAVVVSRDRGTRALVTPAPPASEVGSARREEPAAPSAAATPLASPVPAPKVPAPVNAPARGPAPQAAPALRGELARRDLGAAPAGAAASREPAATAGAARATDALSAPAAQSYRAQVEGQPAPAAAPLAPMQRGAVAPQHVVQLKTLANGEQVAVGSPGDGPAGFVPRSVRTPSGVVKPGARPLSSARDEGASAPAATPPPAANALAAPAREQAVLESPAPDPRVFAKSARGGLAAPGVCGRVRDPRGRMLAGVVLSVAETGASTTSAADGSFCLAAPDSALTLEAFTIGYRPYRARVAPGARGEVGVQLLPVETLAHSTGMGSILGGYAANGQAGPSDLGATTTPQLAARAAAAARAATSDARRDGGAAAWLRAADAWSAAFARATGDPAALADARFHLAESRVNAWRAGHTASERAAAAAATDDYLTFAAAGPLRDLAEAWRKELAP